MRFWLTLPWMLFCHFALHAQLVDDFSDGNLSSDPAWNGDTGDFIITNDHLLQLNAAEAGTSVLSTPITLGDSAMWSFYYRMEFAPSTSNKLRVYLMLSSDNVSTANGYFVEIGENGSEDALRFFRSDNGTAAMIMASDGLFGSDPSQARFRSTRNNAGEWTFLADISGGENYSPLFTVNESTYPLSIANTFAIECTYTDTRKDKFFFDDFFVGLPAPDTTAAILETITVIDATHLLLRFNEALDNESLIPAKYQISPSIGQPASAEFADPGQQEVTLTLLSPLQTAITYTLNVTDVHDLAGNATNANKEFQYVQIDQPQPYDILVNEIMADPSPPVGLPNAEYLELYNRSTKTFQLEDFALTVGSQTEFLPVLEMLPNSYVVLVDEADLALFSAIPNVTGIDLPSLTNSGTTIEIADDAGNTLHRIAYDLNSYQDSGRDDGGWSLELINPHAPCTILSPWKASTDLTGGTPGRMNSVLDDSVDNSGPSLVRIFPITETLLQVVFDEIVDGSQFIGMLDPFHAFAQVIAEDNFIEISLQTPLQESLLYTLSIQQAADCAGNISTQLAGQFALPQQAEAGDLVINELLFDPNTGGSRFIEIINTSNKYIDLSEVIIADIQGDTISVSPINASFLLFPEAIAAITPSVQDILMRYFTHDADQLIENDVPAFDRRNGNATIYTRSGVLLDVFDYREDYHNALLDETQGVSLERISASLPTQSSDTWHSAAQSVGFATPGLPNSQQLPFNPESEMIEVIPEVFSPDQDGTDDFATIQFSNITPGMLATVRVFDATGRLIIRLAENVSIGDDAVIRWDGIDENGEKARIGPYVLWIELFNTDGTVDRFKKTCVLAERL